MGTRWRDAGQPIRVGRRRQAGDHPRRGLRVEAEPAGGVGDVLVDLRRISAEPVVLGAGRLERGVERAEVDLLGGVDAGGDDIHRRRPGQHGRIEVAAVVEQVLLEGERPHAVADDDEWDAGMFRAGQRAELTDVGDEAGPATLAEVAVPIRRTGRAPVATMIVGVHHVPVCRQCVGQPAIPGGVLAHAVGDLDDRLRCSGRRVAIHGHLRAVGCRHGEGRLVHRAACWQMACSPSHGEVRRLAEHQARRRRRAGVQP